MRPEKEVLCLLTIMKGMSRADEGLGAEDVSASGNNGWGSSADGIVVRGRLNAGGSKCSNATLALRFPRLDESVAPGGTESTRAKASI